MQVNPTLTRAHLKDTRSRCTTCHAPCDARVVREGRRVLMVRECAAHGLHETCISSDARFYHIAKGRSSTADSDGKGCRSVSCDDGAATVAPLGKNANACSGPEPFETLSTCLALIEIVDSCNLSCPTCFAASPVGVGERLQYRTLADLKERIQGVIDRKGKIEILQLSGGEPTLHPEFFELTEWVRENPDIDYLLINTNGVRIARDAAFLEELSAAVDYGHMQLYLQFDGTDAAAHHELRGTDLRAIKDEAIENCGVIGLPLTLAMTVVPSNLGELWSSIEYGLRYPHVRGIAFQPMFGSGRCHDDGLTRLNTADIILAAVEQSSGKLRFDDFTPLPCGDPNCATIGYLLKVGDGIRSVSEFVDFSKLQGFLHDKVRYTLEDLIECGCDSEPLGALLKQFEIDERSTFRLFIKPFMDAHGWDEDRIDRCCTHVIRPDGQLDSFCRYYSGFADCTPSFET